MIGFLHFQLHQQDRQKYLKNLLHFVITLLVFLCSGIQLRAQQLDTWFTADRAVNSAPLPSPGSIHLFTPYAPADGTTVTTWYDFIDFTPQDALSHPAPADYPLPPPAGFDYPFPNSVFPLFLSPTGSIPGQPILERNEMNFNPVVRFDGSGNGQALHFDSDSRNDVTVIVVFRAAGAGTTAETQRLLFGGDVDTHHLSFNPDDITTNLSLGVSAGDRFSIGRTWSGDGGTGYFQGGGINLLRKPTIGLFQRTAGADQETFLTHVNGVQDISTTRNHPLADNSLFFFNRLGKHFNSNDSARNLTGDISEVMLLDGAIPPTAVQVAESYLAIKYGITLSNGPTLGSEDGNTNYNYVAADGTVIWTAESTYIYDIAGIGADRYEDFDAGLPGTTGDLKLRFNLHQRISKSENPEAIVTMSTNTDFIQDNLDTSRTEVDNGTSVFSYLHNYLMWASDRQPITEVTTELPPALPQITSRIEREWRVQMDNSPGLTPIGGVSVRINLTGSTIINNGDCALHLMIDTDNDGDFTTGPITLLQATSIDAFGNVYFDGVDFAHQNVFTVGFGDIEDPTASNPDPLVVCDTAPAPDPLVVDDEADNCAVDSVTHISDVSDGLTNPETITRTYRITDTSGNFIDVQQTIEVYTSPNAGTSNTISICQGDTTTIDLFGELSGSPDTGGTWTDVNNLLGGGANAPIADATAAAMNFSGAASGTYIFNYTITPTAPSPCPADSATVTVIIVNQPDAGTNGTLTICTGDTLTDAQLFAALGGTPDVGGTWSPALAGAGTYTYTVTATAPCATDATATVTVTEQPLPDAGTNGTLTICTGDTVTDAQLFAALGGTPDVGGTWSPALAGAGTYTYTVTATAPCATNATATVTVTEQPLPDAGTNGTLTICTGDTLTDAQLFAALGGTPDVGGTWSPALAGAGTYTYTVAATAPCATDATATVTVTEQPLPDAGTNGTLTICTGDTLTDAQLFAQLGGTPDVGGTWSPALAGAGTYTYTVAATAPCATDATATVTVTEQPQPDAGSDDNLVICEGETVTAAQLFAALGGTPDVGGTWSPALAGAGTYTYTVAATAPCAT
ncbi:hypothetical protein PP183_16145, partial [Muricauda sp. AC10]|nr:hypothetical protein [Muricauda sp. AC10]